MEMEKKEEKKNIISIMILALYERDVLPLSIIERLWAMRSRSIKDTC